LSASPGITILLDQNTQCEIPFRYGSDWFESETKKDVEEWIVDDLEMTWIS
jgi:hypothetical protein